MNSFDIPADILAKREKLTRHNRIVFMFEGFFFSFAVTMNSQQTVMPAYIEELSGNAFYISLISVIFYGCTYFARVFACLVGLNTKSPKRATVIMCGLHRVGFLLLFLSTFFAGSNTNVALLVVLLSFAACCILSGASSPVFSMLVANTITDRVGAFFGSYTLAGAVAGIIASRVLTKCYEACSFPMDYRAIFLICFVMAVIALLVLAVGIKEVPYPETGEKTRVRDLPKVFIEVWRGNPGYKRYVAVRMAISAAEVSMPFFIVRVGRYEGITAGYVGMVSLTLLVSKMIASKVMGRIADKRGTVSVLTASCVAGAAASLLVLSVNGYFWIFPVFFLVSFAQNGVYLSESVANITYSNRRDTTVYAALSGLLLTPVSIVVSLAGGLLAERFSPDLVFLAAAAVYLAVLAGLWIRGAAEKATAQKK